VSLLLPLLLLLLLILAAAAAAGLFAQVNVVGVVARALV
jgi:hypothetical protein